jgi:outer membrane protein OmpA-like peptidoglycan-associated protein
VLGGLALLAGLLGGQLLVVGTDPAALVAGTAQELAEVAQGRGGGEAVPTRTPGPRPPAEPSAPADDGPETTIPPVEDRPSSTAAPQPAPVPEPPAASLAAPDLREVAPTTVSFAVGAVLDATARELLLGLADVLAAPDAAPVLVVGYAEPGPDEAAALRLAQARAQEVAEALVELGVPEVLIRSQAVVDGDAGRSVVVSPLRP